MPDQLTLWPCFYMALNNKSTFTFGPLAQTSPQIGGFGFQICCDLRLENGTINYIHLQCRSPQSVISKVPNSVVCQGSVSVPHSTGLMQMGGEVHKSFLSKEALTRCSFEDM